MIQRQSIFHGYSDASLAELIQCGSLESLLGLRVEVDRYPELAKKVLEVCTGHATDDPHGERYRVWLEYVGEWRSGDPGDAPLEVWGKESR